MLIVGHRYTVHVFVKLYFDQSKLFLLHIICSQTATAGPSVEYVSLIRKKAQDGATARKV